MTYKMHMFIEKKEGDNWVAKALNYECTVHDELHEFWTKKDSNMEREIAPRGVPEDMSEEVKKYYYQWSGKNRKLASHNLTLGELRDSYPEEFYLFEPLNAYFDNKIKLLKDSTDETRCPKVSWKIKCPRCEEEISGTMKHRPATAPKVSYQMLMTELFNDVIENVVESFMASTTSNDSDIRIIMFFDDEKIEEQSQK